MNGSLGDVTPLSDTSAEVTYTPNLDFNGSDSFTFQVEDPAGGTATGTVSLEVTPVNDPPVANDDALGDLQEDAGPTILDVLANDTDPEGDTLTIAGVGAALHGTVVNNGNNLTYTPNPVTSNSAESFVYAVNDGQGGMDTATVSFTVINVNDPPTAFTDTPTVAEDSGANAIDVLANDTDPNADTLTVSAVTQPANGTVVNNGANVSYTPNLNFNGADSFTYTVDDGNGGSDIGTVNVTVTNVNDAPTPVDDALAQGAVTTEDSSVIIDVLANDTDPDIPTPGDTLMVVGVDTTGTLGLVTNNGTNVTYNPNGQFENLAPGQSMTDTFTYTIQDAAAAAGTTFATVTVTINGVNDPPIVNVSPSFDALGNTALQVVNSGGSQTISPAVFATYAADLLTDASITDPDGPGPFTFALNSATTGAVVNVNSGGTFDYTPPAGTSGPDNFTYTVSDGAGGMATGTVDISITGIVWFVQNDHSGTNQGTSTNPFQTLAAAETAAGTGDTIFVREGDGTTAGQNAGISLKDNQRLIGEGVALTTGGTFNGTVNQQLIAAGNKPLIGNTTTHGVTINDVTGVEVRGLNISTTAGSGVAVSEAAGGTVTATVSDNTLSGTTAGFEASTTTGTVNIDLSRNTGLTASAGPAVDINGSAGGTLNITGFADNTVSGTTSGIGISVNTATFDADPADADFTGDQVSGGATAVGSGADPVGTHGIRMTSVSGDLAFTDLDIFNAAGTGLQASSTGTLNAGAGTGFSLTIPAGSTISSTGGPALDLDPLTAGITLDTIASTSSATTGIDLTAVAGTVDINGGNITGSTGTGFNINGGTATISYDGSITQSNNAAMVSVSGGHSTGTVTFQTGTLSATNGTGLQFDNADGTYNFNGTNTLAGGDAGIDIVNGSAGTFTFSSNSSITDPTGTGFNLNGGNGTVTYSGTISKNNAGRAVEVQNRTGGTATFAGTISSTSSSTGLNVANNSSGAPTITFSGATKTINTGANDAVTLSSNTGATINFSNGGLDIDTTSGTGFTATGGGTVNITGSSNSITSTSGKALDAAN
ncbi:MAG TPA: tandem-95 repeat protein, partial [Verrucomicrobiae bacterium]|nr:tandem-95 repeat protein [Verrucomicrobiae bacterium]